MSFLVLLVVAAGLYLVVNPVRIWRGGALRRLRAAPTHGRGGDIVRMSGWVDEIPEPLEAPLSGAACAAYAVTARLRYPLPAPETTRSIAAENRLTEFWLCTTRGRVRVRGERVELVLPLERTDATEARRQAFAERWRLTIDNVPNLDAAREVAVVPGDLVSVLGLLCEVPTEPDRTSYRETSLELQLIETPEREIVIGPVAPEEEAALRAAYAKERAVARRGSHEP